MRNPEAELARAVDQGTVDSDRVGKIIEAMRPLPRARRDELREQLADWPLPPITGVFAAR